MSQTQKIGNVATEIYLNDEGWTCVKYHNTDVVKVKNETIILNSNGYHTATTKLRINQTANQWRLGFEVIQKNFEWYVKVNPDFIESIKDERGMLLKPCKDDLYDFRDEMELERVI